MDRADARARSCDYGLSFLKFGREHCTHAYLAKVWGGVLVGVFTAILGFGEDRYSVPVLFVTYLISFADVIGIIVLLPKWQCDVPSCFHAWLIRRNTLSDGTDSSTDLAGNSPS